jgi:3-dehydroquinate synthase
MVHHMRQDKKVIDGRLTFVLARGIGRAFIQNDVAAAAVKRMLTAAMAAPTHE